jgi:hypothetical protein
MQNKISFERITSDVVVKNRLFSKYVNISRVKWKSEGGRIMPTKQKLMLQKAPSFRARKAQKSAPLIKSEEVHIVGCKMLLLNQDIWRLKKQGTILQI